MRIWSNSTVLLHIDSITIAIVHGYMLARPRLTSHPSPIFRLTAFRDDAIKDANLLEREFGVYSGERDRIPSK